jgi:hypothetical protein
MFVLSVAKDYVQTDLNGVFDGKLHTPDGEPLGPIRAAISKPNKVQTVLQQLLTLLLSTEEGIDTLMDSDIL